MEIELNTPIFFTKEDLFICSLIKEQGHISCRENFSIEYIRYCLEKFDCGYVVIGEKDNIRKCKKEKYVIKGYILFIHDVYNYTIMGKIFCVREGYKGLGVEILNCVKQYAEENNVTLWKIQSLPFEKLINYYKNYGFIESHKILDNRGNFKVQEMYMTLTYEITEDDFEY